MDLTLPTTNQDKICEFEWPKLLTKVISGTNLTFSEAYSAMNALLSKNVSEIVAGGFLVALRAKVESVQEMAGMASAMIDFALPLEYPGDLLDTCGTGGDQKHTVNISTMAAIVAASAGLKVAKHGNRAASSKSGSADVLEYLGVKIDLGPQGVAACIERANLGFCMAPKFHGAMANVGPVRRALAVPTVFNFLGPLVNPARAKYQIVGVFDPTMLNTMAQVLGMLGSKHALVVHAADGYDELSTTSTNMVIELKRSSDGDVTFDEYLLDPRSFGFDPCDPVELEGGDAVFNAEILLAVFSGKHGPVRDIVLLNSGAALYVGGGAPSITAGIAQAATLIDSGAANRTLYELIETSNSVNIN